MAFAPTSWMAFDMAFMRTIKPQVDILINPWSIPKLIYLDEDSSMKSELGIYITNRKRDLKVTQDWIAEKMSVSSNAVSKWVKTGKISRENFFLLVDLLGSEGAPYLGNVIDEKNTPVLPLTVTVIKPTTERDKWMADLTQLAGQLDLARLGMLVKEARQLVAEMPAKQTPQSTG
jgi:hypothetical protein